MVLKAASFLNHRCSLPLCERSNPSLLPPGQWRTLRRDDGVRCAKRSGKQRYPSEKRKLRRMKESLVGSFVGENEQGGFCRLSKLGVPARLDPGKDFHGVSPPLLAAVAKVLEFPVPDLLPADAFTVVRKAFDARKVLKEPEFVYTVDVDVKLLLELEPRTWDFISRLEPKFGVVEYMPRKKVSLDLMGIMRDFEQIKNGKDLEDYGKAKEDKIDLKINDSCKTSNSKKVKIAVVGSGPSGLFACLVLSELGADVTLIERGRAVEQRGRDIGALVARRLLDPESNFCFGEGGAGTWSDGKLITRIGRNSSSVQAILKSLVCFGAPSNILVDGKPHLGTDRLVPLLRSFRHHLQELGIS